MNMNKNRFRSKLRDTSGSSIIIALVFFLICAIIGSVVVTAASVEAKSVQTHKDLQQAEFTISSAAKVLAEELRLPLEPQRNSGNVVTGLLVTDTDIYSKPAGRDFWDAYGMPIMEAYRTKSDLSITGLSVTQRETDAVAGGSVTGNIVISKDLDIDIDLDFIKTGSSTALYKMHVYLQCVPTFDREGNLLSFEYAEPVITKNETGAN